MDSWFCFTCACRRRLFYSLGIQSCNAFTEKCSCMICPLGSSHRSDCQTLFFQSCSVIFLLFFVFRDQDTAMLMAICTCEMTKDMNKSKIFTNLTTGTIELRPSCIGSNTRKVCRSSVTPITDGTLLLQLTILSRSVFHVQS